MLKSLKLVQRTTRAFSEIASTAQNFRTPIDDPLKHSPSQIAQFYKIASEDKRIFAHGGLPKSYEIQAKTFNETCLMVRRPALDIINCLENLDFTKPAVRFVLYGEEGAGKSLALAHILHYGYKKGFLLVHVPWPANWMRKCKESSNSDSRDGFIDLNVDAAAWLVHFKSQNEHLLSDNAFRTSQEYVWSKRESTPKGASIIELIDHGINRIKYASDCVVYLAEELKKISSSGAIKTLVAIDGFNVFFHPKTRVYTEKKERVHPHKITLTQAFLNLAKFNWNNAAIILTVDQIANSGETRESFHPRYLLGKDGFDFLDPFVPVSVTNYTEKELKSCLDYYRERKWIQPVQGQDHELAFITDSNPYKLMQVCASL